MEITKKTRKINGRKNEEMEIKRTRKTKIRK